MQRKVTKKVKRRVILTFAIMTLVLFGLSLRVAWIQVIKNEEYSKKALSYQIRDESIDAKRGKIYDKTGKELAISAATYSIWVRPEELGRSAKKGEVDEKQVEKTIKLLAKATGKTEEELKEQIKNGGKLVRVGKYIEKDVAESLSEKRRPGVELEGTIKRYYPLGEFAAHVLGSVTDDSTGLSGIELKYEQYMRGIPGRWIKETDAKGKNLAFAKQKYYEKTDGFNLILTIDEVLQHYVEKEIKVSYEATGADKVMCIMMNPKTAEIMAMASYPDFDPNDPRTPMEAAEQEKLAAMTTEEKIEYWNRMWRNPMINDTYEPGSTFKLLTTAMALEDRNTHLGDTFVCNSYYSIAGQAFRCPAAHGTQNLATAVKNSCNPAMATLAHRIGVNRFYEYLGLFGLTEKTHVDLPGEAESILQDKKYAGPVGLATMSYGQGIAVTPLHMITAISVFGNEGKLMQPHLVHKLVDGKGKTIKTIEPNVVRQVVSKQTADEMKLIMENAVLNAPNTPVAIPGYRVGGKTGTAQKPLHGKYTDEMWSSFVGMAPMEDPKVTVLVIVDNPKGAKYGSIVAAPLAKRIMEEALRYLHVQPNYTKEEQAALNKGKIGTPSVTNMEFKEAIRILKEFGLKYQVSPLLAENESLEELKVVDQYPKAGELIPAGGTVALYRE